MMQQKRLDPNVSYALRVGGAYFLSCLYWSVCQLMYSDTVQTKVRS